jgi:hypothetical protein
VRLHFYKAHKKGPAKSLELKNAALSESRIQTAWRDVRFGSLAAATTLIRGVRFNPESGHEV